MPRSSIPLTKRTYKLSKISLQPNSSGTGTFTLVAPDSNTNRTLTLPDEAGTVATVENLPAGYTDSDALDLFNATGSAPVYACRAWVNFDGTGTVAIRASGNVSSITDNGTGNYSVNFTTSMLDNDYAVLIASTEDQTVTSGSESNYSANFVKVFPDGGLSDSPFIFVSVFR
jgi:hypothetical protein